MLPFLCVPLWALTFQAEKSIVWQIGRFDQSYSELALSGNYEAYPKRFGKRPLVFEVGKSRAEQNWPYIHPGPADAWAGSRVHPWTIRFSLDKAEGCFELIIGFTDTHSLIPPKYEVSINGRAGYFRLPRGRGDASLRDPKAGKPYKVVIPVPEGLLRKGMNTIVLSCREGSWVLYDAVALRKSAKKKTSRHKLQAIAARSTPFFIRQGGKIKRVVEVRISVAGAPEKLRLRVEVGGKTYEVPFKNLPLFGEVRREIAVPDSDQVLEVKITAFLGEESKSTTISVAPERRWRIFLAPCAHTDIGYTDIQPKCRQRHNENLDRAADLISRFPDFRWNCEVTWQAENYLSDRSGKRLRRFLELARQRRIGIQALYCNILTGLCSHEELCRLTAKAYELHRRYKIPYVSAMIDDVPTWVGALPMVLANSGIRYFTAGSNNTRAPTFRYLYDKSPFWWEGPDGSRILAMFVPGYGYAARMGFQSSVETARNRLLKLLEAYKSRNYPYDAIYLNGAVGDNQPLNERLASVVSAWNKRYEFPRIILCHNAEFFEYLLKRYGDKFPVYRGSGGAYWEDGAASSARETAQCRAAHEVLGNAERWFALAHAIRPQVPYPGPRLAKAWRNVLLYDEHTWGAYCSISRPESEFTKAQWKIKAQFAHDAISQSRVLLSKAVNELATLIPAPGPSLVVFNPMSWGRGDLIEVSLPQGMALADPDIPSCRVGEETLIFLRGVPSCGYRVLALKEGKEKTAARRMAGTKIESRYYRVTFDPNTGAIVSLIDKELGRELVDPKAPYSLNQYLYVSGGEKTSLVHAGLSAPKLTVKSSEPAKLTALDLGPLGQRMVVKTKAYMTPEIVTEVTVYNEIKRVDIVNRVTKKLTYKKEAVYFAFPFSASKPEISYEEPCMIVRPEGDLLPGACLDWFAVQHFVQIAARDVAISWASPDAPLVCFEDINRGKWQTRLPIKTGHLYAYVMNNYWFTNYLAGQGGKFTFRFSITSAKKANVVSAAHFGWGVSNPFQIVLSGTQAGGILPPGKGSLVEVDEPNVLIIGMKNAETGDGLVLRLWEVTGKPTKAHIRLPQFHPVSAIVCNLVEEPLKGIKCSIEGSTIAIPIRGAGLATLLVQGKPFRERGK